MDQQEYDILAWNQNERVGLMIDIQAEIAGSRTLQGIIAEAGNAQEIWIQRFLQCDLTDTGELMKIQVNLIAARSIDTLIQMLIERGKAAGSGEEGLTEPYEEDLQHTD